MDNYEKMIEKGKNLFLSFDQNEIISRWKLDFDENSIYFTYIGKEYVLDRNTGGIKGLNNMQSLVIYDLFCHEENGRALSGNYCSLSALVSKMAVSGPVGSYQEEANILLKDEEKLIKQAKSIGGKIVQKGDIGLEIPIFKDINVMLLFWRSDDEFSASMNVYFDENILGYLKYETLYYLIDGVIENLKK